MISCCNGSSHTWTALGGSCIDEKIWGKRFDENAYENRMILKNWWIFIWEMYEIKKVMNIYMRNRWDWKYLMELYMVDIVMKVQVFEFGDWMWNVFKFGDFVHCFYCFFVCVNCNMFCVVGFCCFLCTWQFCCCVRVCESYRRKRLCQLHCLKITFRKIQVKWTNTISFILIIFQV